MKVNVWLDIWEVGELKQLGSYEKTGDVRIKSFFCRVKYFQFICLCTVFAMKLKRIHSHSNGKSLNIFNDVMIILNTKEPSWWWCVVWWVEEIKILLFRPSSIYLALSRQWNESFPFSQFINSLASLVNSHHTSPGSSIQQDHRSLL